jgi:hypothetical protein
VLRRDAKSINGQNREFHHHLKTDWRNWPVFQFDWDWREGADRSERTLMEQRWQKMYDAAKEINSLLGFVALHKKTTLSRRLFLPLPSAKYLRPYLEYSAPFLPLELWSKVDHKDIPNRIKTHAWIGGWIIAIE